MVIGGRWNRVPWILYIFLLIIVADLASLLYALWRGPFPLKVERGTPTAYLNLYVHVPAAWVSYLLFFLAMISSIYYIRTRIEAWDDRAYSFALTGEVFGVVALVTGAAWASESWGAPWNWDPRQTGVLLLILAYLGYFALRASIVDPDKMKLVTASYSIAAFSLVPLSFLAAYLQESLHPKASEAGSFLALGGVALVFGSRILFATLTGLSASLLMSRRDRMPAVFRRAMAVFIIIALVINGAFSLSLASPYLVSEPRRVVDAILEYGRIAFLALDNGSSLSFDPPIEAPISPASTEGEPSIIGHLVIVDDGSLEVVRHWSVAFNSMLYALAVLCLVLAVYRRWSQ